MATPSGGDPDPRERTRGRPEESPTPPLSKSDQPRHLSRAVPWDKSSAAELLLPCERSIGQALRVIATSLPASVQDRFEANLRSPKDSLLNEMAACHLSGKKLSEFSASESAVGEQDLAKKKKKPEEGEAIKRAVKEVEEALKTSLGANVGARVRRFLEGARIKVPSLFADLARASVSQAFLHDLVREESDLDKLSDLLANASLNLVERRSFVRSAQVFVRADYDGALTGTSPLGAPIPHLRKVSYYTTDKPPSDEVYNFIEGRLQYSWHRIRDPKILKVSEDDTPPEPGSRVALELGEQSITIIPYRHGDTYLGSILLVTDAALKRLRSSERKDMLYVAHCAAQGIAHVHRLENAEPPRPIG